MHLVVLTALLLCGAIFGFFYAWVCSTMWGLDTLPPDVAIAAMQAMNGSVRNVVFAPAFFGTGPALFLAAAVVWRGGVPRSAGLLAVAGLVYVCGAMLLTFIVNVPMNEALAMVDPASPDAAQVWAAYSGRWQVWNVARTVASGLALALCGFALIGLNAQVKASAATPRTM